MAIAVNSVTNSTVFAGTATPSVSVTVAGGLSESMLLVALPVRGSASDANLNASSVTYGADALTRYARYFFSDGGGSGGSLDIEFWRLVNPTADTRTITVTYPGSIDHGAINTAVLTGVDQTTPIEAGNSAGDAAAAVASPATVNVTTLTDGALVWDATYNKIGTAITVGAGQTQRMNLSPNGGGDRNGASSEPTTTAGSVTMSWTFAGADAWAIAAISIKPYIAPAVGATGSTFLMMGV